jgi:hypothetical protein
MIVNSNDSKILVNSLMGHIDIHRYLLHFRRCKEGYAPFDRVLDINDEHKITKGLTEVVCDFAQRIGAFEEASYMLEKYLGIKISGHGIFKDNKILNKDKERHIIIEKDYVASLEGAAEFKKMLWAMAIKNGFQNAKEVVILGDGAEWIWNIARELFPNAVFILDYYHFEEHIYECANALYPEDEVGRKRWADSIISRFIKTDEIDKAIRSLNPEDFELEETKQKVSG